MDFRILGPLEVRDDPGAVVVRGVKQRAVLAMLLLNANEPVSADRLATAIWGEDARADAAKTVQVNVSRLRKALAHPDLVATTPGGYCLRVGPDELDADRFARLVEEGRRALAAGRPERAGTVLREALALWRGPPLADMAFEAFAQSEIARLTEQRLSALELRVEADLAAGSHAALVGELQQLVAAHRSRERLAGQLMLALYRCERQSEALAAYREVRRALVEESGVEPGPQLRSLHEAILRQDPSLDLPVPASELPAALDAGDAPFAGRDAELHTLRDCWELVRRGDGAFVTLSGPRGIGKTRLAAEFAAGVHADGGAVLYATGNGDANDLRNALRRGREAQAATLLVVDNADRARSEAWAALQDVVRSVASIPLLLLVSGEDAVAPEHDADAVLALEPLGADAVDTIARSYLSGQAAATPPVDELLETSEGVPQRVHEAASAWARRDAARRVTVAAGQASHGRSELRTMQSELADSVIDLREASDRVALLAAPDAAIVCPFKGLASFEPEDAEYFFGRERLVAELVSRVVGAPLLAIVGSSGSGKSSVLRAGLLPALESGVLPGSEGWRRALLRPGERPQRELDAAVAGVGRDERIVIAVDQFEEVFTACDDERERTEFIGRLVRAAQDPLGRCLVVLTVRADYYERCAAYPGLSALLAANHVLVSPMQPDELRRAVERPALRVGLRVERELVDTLVVDVEGEPGALPLLSTALLELWRLRDGRRLRHAAYERSGGVRGAVARLAEEAYGKLDPAQQAAARGTLGRLAAEGEGGTVERRRVPLAELETERRDDVARIIELFTEQRLLTVSAGSVEVAHEALLREWPRLRTWIQEDRESLRIHRGVTAAAEEWRRLDRDDGALFRGTHLVEANEWRAARRPALNAVEREFLDASEARLRGERAARRRRIRIAFAGLVGALAAITAVAIVALYQGREASTQRDIAASRELAARSATFLEADPGLSLSLALTALQRRDTEQAENVVRQATLAWRGVASWPAHRDWIHVVDPSADGRHVVTAGRDGAVRIWDLASGRRLWQVEADPGAWVLGAALSPDGDHVATAGDDGVVASWDVATRRKHVLLKLAGNYATGLDYSPDGRRIAASMLDGSIRILAARGGAPAKTLTGFAGPAWSVRFSSDGTHIAGTSDDQSARIWDLRNGTSTRLRHPASVTSADFSPDGRALATAAADGVVRVWDARTGKQLARMGVDGRELNSVRFSADGRRLVSAGDDGVVRVWAARGGPPLSELRGGSGTVLSAAFVAGSDDVVSGGEDGKLRVWLPAPATLMRGPVTGASFAPDGRVVSGGDDGVVRIWDTAGHAVAALHGHTQPSFARFSADGSRVVSASYDGSVRVWDGASGRSTTVLSGNATVFAAAFDPSGRRVAIAGTRPRLLVQGLDGTDRIVLRGHRGVVRDVAFSPDGRQLASASDDGTVRTWDAATGRLERTLRGHGASVLSVTYDAAGRRLVSAGSDGTVRVWPLRGGPPVILRGHQGPVAAAAFNPAGDRVVSAGQDGTIRVWNAAGGEPLVLLYTYHGPALSAAFDASGRRVVSAGSPGVVRVDECEVCGSLASAIRLAHSRDQRRLSAVERERLLAPDG